MMSPITIHHPGCDTSFSRSSHFISIVTSLNYSQFFIFGFFIFGGWHVWDLPASEILDLASLNLAGGFWPSIVLVTNQVVVKDLEVWVPPKFMIFRRASFWIGPEHEKTQKKSKKQGQTFKIQVRTSKVYFLKLILRHFLGIPGQKWKVRTISIWTNRYRSPFM